MASVGNVMRQCRNYFEGAPAEGLCAVDDQGRLTTPEPIAPSRFVAIRGSVWHDGVWPRSGDSVDFGEESVFLPAETFAGRVWPLYPSQGFLALCERIDKFEAETPRTAIASESFGAYSHSVIQGKTGALTWQEAFALDLMTYRRMYTEVGV